MTDTGIGFGDRNSRLTVCIGNRPEVPEVRTLTQLQAVQPGDIQTMVAATGNHWRKVFNIFAKLMFGLQPMGCTSWQQYREECLLQQGNEHALLFSAPVLSVIDHSKVTLVAGKQYAVELGLLEACVDIGDGFFINAERALIVTPYFDYRQLSNVKLEKLHALVVDLAADLAAQ